MNLFLYNGSSYKKALKRTNQKCFVVVTVATTLSPINIINKLWHTEQAHIRKHLQLVAALCVVLECQSAKNADDCICILQAYLHKQCVYIFLFLPHMIINN